MQTKQPTSSPSTAPSAYGLCGSCDDTCDPEKCFSAGSIPPQLLELGFVNTTSTPLFNCINVQMSQDCELMFQLTDSNTFVIEKSRCNLKGNIKLNPNILLESYGTLNNDVCEVDANFPEYCTSGNQNSCGGYEVHTVS